MACHREVCWVLFNLSFIPVKFLSWWRKDYTPMLLTLNHLQLFAGLQKDLLLLPPLINRDVARIQEWCNHWCMKLNPNKTSALLVSRSRTVNPLQGNLVLSVVSICTCPNLDNLGVKFDTGSLSKTMCAVFYLVSLKEFVF